MKKQALRSRKESTALLIVLTLIILSIAYLEGQKVPIDSLNLEESIIELDETKVSEDKIKKYTPAVEILKPSGFLNTDDLPINIQQMIGEKVILVDFWTYTCINCQRTLPYINGWYEKYKDHGFEIVGVHTPEFEFEKEKANVQEAIDRFGIEYPVVQDNDYGTWRAYKNNYWPRKYLIDIDGFIVYDHIGEGGYDETEQKIQELLKERSSKLGLDINQIPTGLVDPDNIVTRSTSGRLSPEIYFGASRNERLSNGNVGQLGVQSLLKPDKLEDSQLYLEGDWDVHEEFAKNKTPYSKIIFPYLAKDVYMVLSADQPVRVKVLRDGKVPGEFNGADLDSTGYMWVDEERLYKIISEDSNEDVHTLELITGEPGLNAFTFTFG